jgi:hypothetical protein
MEPGLNNNGKRVAVLQSDVETLKKGQKDHTLALAELRVYLARIYETLEKRLREMEISSATQEEKLDTACKEISSLRRISNTWNILNSIAAAGASFIGLFTGK